MCYESQLCRLAFLGLNHLRPTPAAAALLAIGTSTFGQHCSQVMIAGSSRSHTVGMQ